MPRSRAIVLEVHGNGRAVVLEDGGRFRTLPAADRAWQTGDEVWVDAPTSRVAALAAALRRRRLRLPRAIILAAACALLLIAVPLGHEWQVSADTMAIVTVDINPSIQLNLSGAAEVLQATALDSDGVRLLHEVNVNNVTLVVALTDLTQRATVDGFVPKTSQAQILLAAAPLQAAVLPQAVATQLSQGQAHVNASLQKQGYHASVSTVRAPRTDVAMARGLHLSLGRYLIYRSAVAAGLKIQPRDLQGGAIARDLAQHGASPAVIRRVVQQAVSSRGKSADRTEQASKSTPAAKGKSAGDGTAAGNGKAKGTDTTGRPAQAAAPGKDGSEARGRGAVSVKRGDSGQAAGQGQAGRTASQTARGKASQSQGQGTATRGSARGPSLPSQWWQDLRRFFQSRGRGDQRGRQGRQSVQRGGDHSQRGNGQSSHTDQGGDGGNSQGGDGGGG